MKTDSNTKQSTSTSQRRLKDGRVFSRVASEAEDGSDPVGQEVVALQPQCSRGRLCGESSVTRRERAESDLLRHLKLQQARGVITAPEACCEQLLKK